MREISAESAWPCRKRLVGTDKMIFLFGHWRCCIRWSLSVPPLEVGLVKTTSSPGACKPETESPSLHVEVPWPPPAHQASYCSDLNGDWATVHTLRICVALKINQYTYSNNLWVRVLSRTKQVLKLTWFSTKWWRLQISKRFPVLWITGLWMTGRMWRGGQWLI